MGCTVIINRHWRCQSAQKYLDLHLRNCQRDCEEAFMTTQTTSMFMMLTVQAPKHVLGFEAEYIGCIVLYSSLLYIKQHLQSKKERK